eukprot:CAMPEP_0170481300 /NCGR_PEP_ID=MMETSP0208-20121228/1789_1 /TAXON_ID=197538 /ORGANISM="Strombidium inclinatum, Strain S3" /LENGTH=419 /DNA_ID=CAMNT_0010753977 /DNA_START=16 /DNA_END=1275 /DNA_ORIENTATION=+
MNRLSQINTQFQGESTSNFQYGKVGPKSDDDVVIVSVARTAMTKAKKGLQKNTAPEIMLKHVLVDVLKKANNFDAAKVEEICIGNVLQPGAGFGTSRMAQFMAGIPHTVPLFSVNRLCSSGLQATSTIASQIKSGQIECGIGGGVESMSLYDMNNMISPDTLADQVFEHDEAQKCLMGMGQTSDNVAEKFNISRQKQDQMAVESHAKASAAEKAGWKADEITVYKTMITDKEGNEKEILVNRDDGVRPQTTMESLGKLKGAFKKGGSTTAGNSSQVTDGAAVIFMAKRSFAIKNNLPIMGRMLSFASAGVPPEIMGIGPVAAIPKALKLTGMTVKDVDVWEVNEAFGSQATYSVETLKIPKEKLNRRGGAIALGHPLGMTGARMIVTLFSELKRTNEKFGVVSMCIGMGMGAAGVFERE